MKISVSIIIPAFNIAPYIGRCLKSVLSQTLKNIEVIVVDDGSTDNTVKEISSYANNDDRIRLIKKKNGGVTSARLAGVRESRGEYIGFVDGDDFIEPDMFEHLLKNAIKYHAAISHCGYQMVFPNRIDYYYNTGRIIQQDTLAGLKDLISGTFIEPGLVNKLFHRNLFEGIINNDLMDLKIKYNEDLLMNFFLFRECKHAVYEDCCPYHYLVRNNSATSALMNIQKLTDPIKVLRIIEDELYDNIELKEIALQKIAYQLVSLATIIGDNREELLVVKKNARRTLKKRLREILNCKACTPKNKLAALWALIWPWSYGLVHKIYACVTGLEKKYKIE